MKKLFFISTTVILFSSCSKVDSEIITEELSYDINYLTQIMGILIPLNLALPKITMIMKS